MAKVILGTIVAVIFVAVTFLFFQNIKLKKLLKVQHTEDGYLNIGFNKYTGATVYQVEWLSEFDKIESSSYILLKVNHLNKNLGVNPVLYDLEAEGINTSTPRK